jgi:hypothetical protein
MAGREMMNGEVIKPGEFVWIKLPSTDKLIECEVVAEPRRGYFDARATDPDARLIRAHIKWVRAGDTPRSIDKKFAALGGLRESFNRVFGEGKK